MRMLLSLALIIAANMAFADEDPKSTLKEAYIEFDAYRSSIAHENNNVDDAGLILNSNNIDGVLVVINGLDESFELAVRVDFEGAGIVAFLTGSAINRRIGISNLAGKPLDSIFNSDFWGVGIGAELLLGGNGNYAINGNGIILHDFGMIAGVGVNLEIQTIRISTLKRKLSKKYKEMVLY